MSVVKQQTGLRGGRGSLSETPPVPTLTATASGQTQINFAWAAPSVKHQRITSYEFDTSPDNATWTNRVTGTGTSFSLTGLTAGSTHYGRVRSYNGTAYSAYASANATTEVAQQTGTILWDGNFDNAHFRTWPSGEIETLPWYWSMPLYGTPAKKTGDYSTAWYDANYYGDGSLCELSSTIIRGAPGTYSARLRVKHDGTTSADWDGTTPTAVGRSERRRTELSVYGYNYLSYRLNALPWRATRWVSISVYIPSDWSSAAATNVWGPLVWQSKQVPDVGISPAFSIVASPSSLSGWHIVHHWQDLPLNQVTQLNQMVRTYRYNTSLVPEAHFASGQSSRNALQNLNKGGWTDFVMQIHPDERLPENGGVGLWRVWMRAGSGPWVYVLNITPDTVNGPDGERFGIGYNAPPSSDYAVNGGYCMSAGMYGQAEAMIGSWPDRIVYIDNVKVGDQNVSFSQMSHDGSSI